MVADEQNRSAMDWVVDCAVYVAGRRMGGQFDYAQALEIARAGEGFVWLGLHDPTPANIIEVAEVYGLDELTAEHALSPDHRPAVERSEEVTVIVLRTTRYVDHPELTETSEVVETGAVVVFIGPQFVITVRHGAPGALGPVRSDLEARPQRLALGPWAVAHAVCDRVVDAYTAVAAAVETDIDAVEESVFARYAGAGGRVSHIYQLKRELVEFKRAVAPLQRHFGALLEDRTLLSKEIRRYFRDVYNNLLRTVERITAFDDLLNSILQARLAQVTVDQNNDMRKIAGWAAIFAVQTFIAGIYGMNFTFMPELGWRYGYPGVMLVMIVTAVVMYRGFRRNNWL
ncbi:magnesium transporter [Asanoa ferruginea]|uniref:Magnesium transporter n=1 Tax=Asanoa ferruginea TaxID=53367 RepID=A0A3D9ZSJ2_9ACTN|nr:magnesium transporter [Asanoa ferruginea]GIF52280.1 magnesium transport protein CorA [Asanoa ferruginea]